MDHKFVDDIHPASPNIPIIYDTTIIPGVLVYFGMQSSAGFLSSITYFEYVALAGSY